MPELLFEETTPRALLLLRQSGYPHTYEEASGLIRASLPQGELIYAENYFSRSVSDRAIDYLLANEQYAWQTTDWTGIDPATVPWQHILWRRDHIRMFGKLVPIPRFSAWYGDEGKSYAYSGLKLEPNSWNKGLLYFKAAVEQVAQTSFNSVLLNWYRDGSDSMGWHADDEPELGTNPIIASVNLGATRRFLMRRTDDKSHKFELPLSHGSLLIMGGEMQHYWQHAIPKERKVGDLRINLTFRTIR